MNYNFLIILFMFFFSLFLEAESLKDSDGFSLELNAPSQQGNVAYFLKYWEGNTYIHDSVYISDQGKAVFFSKGKMAEGQYVLYIKPDIQVDLLIGNEQEDIKVYIDEKDVMQSKVSGSRDTELFWKYLRVLDDNMQKQFALDDRLEKENLPDKERTSIAKLKDELDAALQAYIQSQLNTYGNTWYGAFLKGTVSPELPFKNPATQDEYEKNKTYLKYHYFDNINLSDPRFWHTNYFISYLDAYVSTVIEQNVDSLASAASRLVAKASDNDYCFEKMLSRFTNESLKSNVMGMENIWMHLYEEYIRDKNLDWIDSIQLKELDKLYVQAEHNRIGMKAHDLQLQTLDGNKLNIYDIESDYLLLYFYNPTCEYCEQEIPLIHQNIYTKYKQQGLKIVAIDIAADTEGWKSFVGRLGLNDWINCADPEYKSDYWIYYDTSGTPATFLLDKDKIIIGRKFDKEGLERILNYYINK